MEPFDVAVALREMIGRPSMDDAEPIQSFDEPRRSELRSVVFRECQAGLTAALGQP